MKTTHKLAWAIIPLAVSINTYADQQILDDLIVGGSACIGQDCVNGENFSFDTLRLKENNLRIKFDDTSSSGSFPSNDWQITANDSTNGGQNKFSIDDVSGSKTPFTIEASAPNHSLYVDDGGRIGIGTSTPVVELHVVNGDSPTMRLEQNGSSGFTAQTWDVAANETNFFIRDATNGSKLPFRIRPGAPDSSLYIDTNGDIGLGTSSPAASLHIQNTKTTEPKLILENTGTTAGDKNYIYLKNSGDTQIVFSNKTSNVDWKVSNTNNDFYIVSPEEDGVEFKLDRTGNLNVSGVVTGASSRLLKENIVSVDTSDVLNKIASLGVYTWNYIKEDKTKIHLGPMAEDFHKIFSLNGEQDDKIAYTDITGVTLAAIQALKSEADEKDKRIAQLEQQLQQIQEKLNLIN
ncbi:tail fiber domain-containing protein [Shewanella ulleungensis]|nr:tail fiber domain-containing protein [Shewanella ulleungensis]MCL1149837.1 tail fiber domain-containing protein [Shewanella ulleungensis]